MYGHFDNYSFFWTGIKYTDVEMVGFGANSQEKIFEMSLVQKGGFIKARGQTFAQKELHWRGDRWLIIYFHVGRVLGIA